MITGTGLGLLDTTNGGAHYDLYFGSDVRGCGPTVTSDTCRTGPYGATVDPVPGPIPGAGLLSYIALGLLGLGSIGWKRLQQAA
jgi:hypothetical protein